MLSRYILAFALTYNGAPLFLLGIVDMHFGKPPDGKFIVSVSNNTRKFLRWKFLVQVYIDRTDYLTVVDLIAD